MSNFDEALKVILRHEGGYVNHPKDPGGITNLGVTKDTWEAWTKTPATAATMRALTPSDVAPLYRARYWDECRCDDLPSGLALCVFDFAVNSGPGRASRYLQNMVGAGADGKVGPQTIAAVSAYVGKHGAPEAIRQFQNARMKFLSQLPTFATFGRGWTRRVRETETEALRLS